MGSQFVDYDGDGRTDLVTATFDGSPHVALGTAAGFAEPKRILDHEGARVRLGQYWDYDAEAWRGLDSTTGHCTSAVVFDWDADDDFDLLLGDHDAGHLYLQRNDGAAGAPEFCGTSEMVLAGRKPFALSKGMGSLRLVDWDGDGLVDLVATSFGESFSGAEAGGVYWYRNTGAVGAPEFAAAVALIAPTRTAEPRNARPNTGLYADPVDYDGDGDLDLLVGGYGHWTPVGPRLTDAMESKADRLSKEVQALRESMRELRDEAVEGVDYKLDQELWRERLNKCTSTAAYKRLSDDCRAKQASHEELRPRPQREPGVWLFRRIR